MAKSIEDIVNEISNYIARQTDKTKSHWYVGIASDPSQRLFTDHKVSSKNGKWVYSKASSSADARAIEAAFVDSGYDGGGGGGDDSTVYVYAYLKTDETDP